MENVTVGLEYIPTRLWNAAREAVARAKGEMR